MFLEKYANVQSDVKNHGDEFRVYVYDLDVFPNSKNDGGIMWMTVKEINGQDDKYLYVSIVNFDNDMYYKLPQNKQTACSTVLFKKFIRYYNEHYGRKTDYWWPVGAEFHNLDLDQKMDDAIEAGIFPPESRNYITRVDEEHYEQDGRFNKKNRDFLNTLETNPQEIFPGFTVEFDEFDESLYFTNANLQAVLDIVAKIDNQMIKNIDKEVACIFKKGNTMDVVISRYRYGSYEDGYARYFVQDKSLRFSNMDNIEIAAAFFRKFDANTIANYIDLSTDVTFDGYWYTLQEIFDKSQEEDEDEIFDEPEEDETTARTISRLKRVGTHK